MRITRDVGAYGEGVLRAAFCVTVFALLAACASTARVESAKGLAATGKQYTAAMDALAATALERRLDRGVRDLNTIRDAGPATTKILEDALAQRTQNARIFAEQIGLYRAQLQVLTAYFEALDALASVNVKAPYEEAVAGAAGDLSALGAALGSTGLSLTDGQQQALGTLAGLVAEQAHARVVVAALKRDAAVIARQLALQKEAVKLFVNVLGTETDSRLAEIEVNDVRRPYVAQASADPKPALPAGWANAWKGIVRERALAQEAQTAITLTAGVETAWTDYLQGKVEAAALVADLKRLQAVIDALGKVRDKGGAAGNNS